MMYETDRLVCVVANSVAHIQFKGPEVVEYTEAVKIGPELRHVVESFEFKVMLIDCAPLNCVTSTMLEAFISAYLRCRRKDREVRIVNTTGLVRGLLRTTRLDRLMPVCDRVEDALKIDEGQSGNPER